MVPMWYKWIPPFEFSFVSFILTRKFFVMFQRYWFSPEKHWLKENKVFCYFGKCSCNHNVNVLLVSFFVCFLSQATCYHKSDGRNKAPFLYCYFSTLLLGNLKCTEPVNVLNVLHTSVFTWHFKTVYINEN